ncbi:neuropeptide SIFamide receptor-like isoform X2 [Daktulosphaira vitifoliae]|nr:neuropeptide SIFamide receptor-like isoform X2 [Daktulosphaira vitifoliae]XP_050541297.1 neuropeptide SIFamide receptor-like isoform X2 [Daktulosphaira vitifoliae]XP_050541298.1 neuropeptide SIFamide receptor-like isoform X2 [Daktulosphaira vitifoliae]XP_050541300.1 neuropeptide SIFamide receptor-like isoform X2 [Daktulosphaira vitifoliae]
MRYSIGVTIVVCIAYITVFVIGFIGNTSVVLVIYKNVRMQSSPTNIFIVNLAVADLLVVVVCIPFTLISSITTEWRLGLTICKLVPYFQGVSVNASINFLVAISVERCMSICFPMNPVGKGICKRAVFVVWIISLIITIPWALYFDVQLMEEGSDRQICVESWPTPEYGNWYYVFANLLMCYILPLSIIAVCYLFIWLKVSCRKVPGEPMHNSASMVQRSKMKVITMILYVVVLFAVSWLPLYVVFTCIKFVPMSPTVQRFTLAILPIAQWLGTANSSINPLLYAIFNHRFRDGYKALLSGRMCQAFDYSNSMKYFNNKAGIVLKRKKRLKANRKKPILRRTIGAIYVHRDDGELSSVVDAIADKVSAAKPRSLSMKEFHMNEEFTESMLQFYSKKYAKSFV